ncbi:hypothetical protein HPB52_009965 [Rhipicephalus sanguineus]|uniref:Uncharacterized protein n=1 Tax=Rhipicephalus sanguineus TaxID=34632 RepID=A0A9D4PR59_RHISA|nr:hypothetical protein HPB52_009965 [Rhipicephalus sanguineus]
MKKCSTLQAEAATIMSIELLHVEDEGTGRGINTDACHTHYRLHDARATPPDNNAHFVEFLNKDPKEKLHVWVATAKPNSTQKHITPPQGYWQFIDHQLDWPKAVF